MKPFLCLKCYKMFEDITFAVSCPRCKSRDVLLEYDVKAFKWVPSSCLEIGIRVLTKVLENLLNTTELNLEDMEEHTMEEIRKSRALLEFIKQFHKGEKND